MFEVRYRYYFYTFCTTLVKKFRGTHFLYIVFIVSLILPVSFFSSDVWREISPILWQLLTLIETRLGLSALDSVLSDGGHQDGRLSFGPWRQFFHLRLSQGERSEDQLLAVLSELNDLRLETEFWQALPRLLKTATSVEAEKFSSEDR